MCYLKQPTLGTEALALPNEHHLHLITQEMNHSLHKQTPHTSSSCFPLLSSLSFLSLYHSLPPWINLWADSRADSPSLYIVVDGGVQLFLLDQVVSPGLLQFHHVSREGNTSQLNSYAQGKTSQLHSRQYSLQFILQTHIKLSEQHNDWAELNK